MTPVLIAVVLSGDLPPGVLHDSADLVEVNHCGELLNQLIWWEDVGGDYRVLDWRMLERAAMPVYDRRRRRWVSRWRDSSSENVRREVEAAALTETWTDHDPEQRDRDVFPVENRRRLTEPER